MRDGSSILLRDRNCEEITYKSVKFSPDGKHVVASDYGGMLRVWKVRTSKLVRKWKVHQDRAFCVAFTPDGRGVVTASYDNTLKYWDLGPLGFGDPGEVQEVLNYVGHTVRPFHYFGYTASDTLFQNCRKTFVPLLFHQMAGGSSLVHVMAVHLFGT
jgi:WD40 repeat protein